MLKSRIPQIILQLPESMDDATEEIANAIADAAKERVPVDTGALRDAIHVEGVEHGHAVVAGDNKAFYGHIVERGSVHAPPHPFLVPAAEAEKAGALKLAAEKLQDL